MSEYTIKLYVEFDEVDAWNDDVINWIMGWLYRHNYSFSYKEYKYDGEWEVDLHTRGLEPVDMFEFVLDGFGDAVRYYAKRYDFGIIVAVYRGDEYIDVQFEDLKRLEDEEHLMVEERWQKMIESMIYGEDDDPEYQEYVEAKRWERLVGIRNDGTMMDAVLEQEGYE